MKKKLEAYLFDDNEFIELRILNLMLIYIFIWGILTLAIFSVFKISTELLYSIAFMITGVCLLFFIANKSHESKGVAIALSCFMNLLILPLFYLFGGGLYSGMPILFVAGIIMTFFLVDGSALIIASIAEILWYIFIISYFHFHLHTGITIKDPMTRIIDIIVCFFISALVPSIIIYFQSMIYNYQRQKVKESQYSIELAGQTKSRFLANMSHELRTPMNAILGMTELLSKEDKDHQATEELNTVKEAAYSLLTSINDVLTFSKLESHKMEIVPVQYRFDKFISDIIYTASLELSGQDIDFYVNVDPEIPAVLYGDDTRIKQVFMYILFNAFKNTDTGRITIEVKGEKDKKNKNIKLKCCISDTGSGLSETELKSIFKSYEIYDSRRDSSLKKVGLELTICMEILKMMKGDIKVDSILSVGTAVEFSYENLVVEDAPIASIKDGFDLKVLAFMTREIKKSSITVLLGELGIIPDVVSSYALFDYRLKDKKYTHVFISDYSYESVKNLLRLYDCEENTYVITDYQHAYGDFGKCKIIRRPVYSLNMVEILNGEWDESKYEETDVRDTFTAPDAAVLIVDDNMVNLKVALGLLSNYEIHASIATSGRECLDKIKQEKFDLILLDQMMPGMDGLETLRAIRNSSDFHYKEVPVICMTASIGEEVRKSLMKAGFQEYLAKPIKSRYLESALKKYLPEDLILQKKRDLKKDSLETKAKEESMVSSGLQVEVGMQNAGGEQDEYTRILNAYYRDGLEKLPCLSMEQMEKDHLTFSTTIHAIKICSLRAGELKTAEIFKTLELASRKGEKERVKEILPEAVAEFENGLEEVKDYLKSINHFEEQDLCP